MVLLISCVTVRQAVGSAPACTRGWCAANANFNSISQLKTSVVDGRRQRKAWRNLSAASSCRAWQQE